MNAPTFTKDAVQDPRTTLPGRVPRMSNEIILGVFNIGFGINCTSGSSYPQNYLLQTDRVYKNITLILKTPLADRFSKARSRPGNLPWRGRCLTDVSSNVTLLRGPCSQANDEW